MAETEQGVDAVNGVQNLTITEEVDGPENTPSNSFEREESVETYKNGFSLSKYYKLCLQYYHKGKLEMSRVQTFALWELGLLKLLLPVEAVELLRGGLLNPDVFCFTRGAELC